MKSVNSGLGFHAEDQNTEIQYVENTQFLFQSRANKIPWKTIIEYGGKEWSSECSDDLPKARKVQSVEHSDLKHNSDELVSFLFHQSISIKLVKHTDIKLISRINICVLQEWMFDFCIFSPQPFNSGLRGRDHQGMERLHIKSRPSLKVYIWILFVEHFLSWTWSSCKISHSNSFSAHSNAYRQMWRSRLSKQRAYPHPLCVPGIYKGLESMAAPQCIFSITHGNDDDDGLLRMCNSRFPISFFNYFFQRILCQVI